MKRTTFLFTLACCFALLLVACAAPTEAPAAEDAADVAMEPSLTIGLIMVGPRDDRGWNQAHWEGLAYVLEHIEGSNLVWFDKLNPADNPNLTIEQVVDDLVEQGAGLIFTNSAEFADGTNNAAEAHPDVTFIHISGDKVLNNEAPANVGNLMGRMEFGKMIAGCAAALSSENGNIAYLGPLIDAETRRLVNSTYLGARHCWEQNGGDAAALSFTVTWIGFWFNIPGVTLDPTQVSNDFIDNGAEVILSGIDTTEALVVSGQRAAAGDNVRAIPYDYVDACAEAAEICLGVPYFNWGPSFLETAQGVVDGTWAQSWQWVGPDWSDINNPDTSAVGWVNGPALLAENQATLQGFIDGLADGSIDLFTGPLNYQDGSPYLADGEKATDEQIWYTSQLLEGVTGASE